MPQLGQTYAAGFASTGGVPLGISVTPMRDDLTRAVRPALLAIVGAVLLVLMIACVNVTNLQLARGAQRRAEFAIRSALGAARMRMVRQLLTESLLLAAAGGALAILVAQFGVRAIVALSPPELPRLGAIRLDAPVFLFGIFITTLVGILAGLVPAIHVFRFKASRTDPQSWLQLSTRTTAGSRQLTRRMLVIAEVALALVLLTSAGLLVRSVQRIFAIDPGFNPHNLLTMQVQTSGHHFADDAATERFFSQALEAVKSVPGVAQAAFTSQLPLSGDYENYGLQFEKDGGQIRNQVAFRYAVSPDYFAAMQIPLRRGRLLTEHDVPGTAMAVVVSESLARSVFGDHLEDAIGQRLRIGPSLNDPTKPWSVIVGVVGEVKQSSLAVTEPDAFYVSAPQWFWSDNKRSLVVRVGTPLGTNPAGLSESVRQDSRPVVQLASSDGSAVFETKPAPGALASSVRNAIWSVDKDQPVLRVATMETLLAASEAQRHFALILFEAFALVALLLAAGGIYGVLSGSVSERMRELGVRSALGATRLNILALVLRQGLLLTLVGAVIGLAGALAASQALTTLLFGISRLDPVTYLGVIAILCLVSVLACWLPARRAARVEPSVVLRAE
jgi:putative ABC transport system permease protein